MCNIQVVEIQIILHDGHHLVIIIKFMKLTRALCQEFGLLYIISLIHLILKADIQYVILIHWICQFHSPKSTQAHVVIHYLFLPHTMMAAAIVTLTTGKQSDNNDTV